MPAIMRASMGGLFPPAVGGGMSVLDKGIMNLTWEWCVFDTGNGLQGDYAMRNAADLATRGVSFSFST
ncbi:hypothetical protein HW571_24385 [Agrobacterium genomosp. 3]|uniref:Uncharacterized protein n=1 Tax=Agrobacterium tumefaciens TaxID=358 RepID=A0AAE6BNH9_AGRTU|nr:MULTISPECIES: hypothetical protein [Agrobacterium tumefaciens complex]MCA1868789.1 hypothetical protein [Agrobacterium tomkonis]MCA1879201.1 hypothetical protein [Agrobacterium tumefaciens]MCA2374972.1 hypothetical protein [Agrobacterium tomkonis CIP 111-78]QCM00371.1 hypothetical protein CFBP6624_09615 [Agrobacterium tumefaciens]